MTQLSRRTLFTGAAGLTVAAALPAVRVTAQTAPAPRVITYNRKLGDAEVTVLLDGYFLLEQAWVTALDPAQIMAGLAEAALDPAAAVPLPITATLIRQGDTLTLIDAGAGGSLGATAGNLPAVLSSIGVDPATISRVVLSHLHPDHIGGLLAGEAAAFGNATLHASDTEIAFWTDPATEAALPEAIRPWFTLAGGVLAAYGDRVTPFAGEADLGGGISTLPMPGHTPGHSGFRVASGDDQLLIWGDSTAVASLQFTHPATGIVFDTDGQQAAETRRRVLDMAVADKLLVSGTHMPFPGFGHVDQKAEAYAWVPEEWKLF